jgi:hypothetical protein
VHQNGRAAGPRDQPLALPDWLCELASAQIRVKLTGCHAAQDAGIMDVHALDAAADRVTGENPPEALNVG